MTIEGQAGACELVAGYFTDYATLMHAHILKEDHFYKATEPILETADYVELKAAFEKFDQLTLGVDGYEHYCQWAHQLAGMLL